MPIKTKLWVVFNLLVLVFLGALWVAYEGHFMVSVAVIACLIYAVMIVIAVVRIRDELYEH